MKDNLRSVMKTHRLKSPSLVIIAVRIVKISMTSFTLKLKKTLSIQEKSNSFLLIFLLLMMILLTLLKAGKRFSLKMKTRFGSITI